MSNYDNTNRGALFKNDNKKTDKHPDYQGSINVEGTERYLSAWISKAKSGKTYMSISLGKPKDQPVEEQSQDPDDFDTDPIPF